MIKSFEDFSMFSVFEHLSNEAPSSISRSFPSTRLRTGALLRMTAGIVRHL